MKYLHVSVFVCDNLLVSLLLIIFDTKNTLFKFVHFVNHDI